MNEFPSNAYLSVPLSSKLAPSLYRNSTTFGTAVASGKSSISINQTGLRASRKSNSLAPEHSGTVEEKSATSNSNLAIHYTFLNHNARSPSKFRHFTATQRTLAASSSPDTQLVSFAPTQPLNSSGALLRKNASSVVGTSVITFGSPLSLLGVTNSAASYGSPPRHKPLSHVIQAMTTAAVANNDNQCIKGHQKLGIEGVRTGLEVQVDAAASRHKTEPPCTIAELDDKRRRLFQSRAKCDVLAGKLQKKTLEADTLRALLALHSEESEVRRRLEGEGWRQRAKDVYHLGLSLCNSSGLIRQLRIDHAAQVDQLQKNLRNLEMTLLKSHTEQKGLSEKEAELKARYAADRSKAEQEIANIKATMEDHCIFSAREKEGLEWALAQAQDGQRRSDDELRILKTLTAENDFLVKQCQLFVRQICQPGFSVVKGPSLEPVEPNRPEPTGFVLIPLPILLHGYTLLPSAERQTIIEEYERKGA